MKVKDMMLKEALLEKQAATEEALKNYIELFFRSKRDKKSPQHIET